MRTIKPGFFLNEELADLPALGRLLFVALWCLSDREGRLEDRPRRIKAAALPYDDCDVDGLLDTLVAAGFILRYEAGGAAYIQVVNFVKHQKPHYKEIASVIPAPPGYVCPDVDPSMDHDQTDVDPTPDDDEASADAGRRTRPAPKPPVYSAIFEREIWGPYPRKQGKLKAWEAYRKYARPGGVDPPPELLSEMTAGLARWKESRQWKVDGVIPHAATFLNGRRWEDEVELAGKGAAPPMTSADKPGKDDEGLEWL